MNNTPTTLTEEQWHQYEDEGYLILGNLLPEPELKALQDRIDEIMLGKAQIDYGRILMQLDSETGKYEEAGEQSKGFKGSTVNYRKIQDLEYDPLFLAFMQQPIFRSICERVYGKGTPVSCFRAMFMNKPANKGTFLPWHQDRWTFLSRDPLLTVWTALDPATTANGCVQVVPGSHKAGLINPQHASGFLTPEQAAHWAKPGVIRHLEMKAGEVAILHNHLLHASDVNRSSQSRRAFSVCYMDASTVHRSGAEHYPTIFGPDALDPAQLKPSPVMAA